MIINKKYHFYLFLVGLSSIPLIALLHQGLPLTHDGQDHVARIANFYQNLTEGNIIPRWAGNLNWGYGHPILMFLYPLPSYITSFFHALNFSLVDSLKIVFGFSFIASGITMYIWLKEFLGEKAGIFGAVLYLFAPYRFIDLYVRGAIGEHVAFIFPPLICYFLFKSSLRFSYWNIIWGSLSLAGLILSHNAMTIMFLPLLILYSLYLLMQSKDKKLYAIHNTLSAIFGFGLSAFFVVPAFFEGKYTLREIVAKGEYVHGFVNISELLYGPWSYNGAGQFSVQIGIMQWAVMIAFLFFFILKKTKKKQVLFCAGIILSFAFVIFIMTASSRPIWETITILQKFQFPWRFLSVTVFLCALMGAYVVFCLPTKAKSIFLLLSIILVLFLNKDFWHANGYLMKPESFFTKVYNGTTDTGESAPIWSVRFMEYPPKALIEVIKGNAVIQKKERTLTKHTYEILATENTRLRENTLFFPGWKVLVDGRVVSVEFQDQLNRGLMTFYVPKGKHSVEVLFSETKLRFISDVISIFSLVILVFYGILEKKNLWRRFRLH